MSAANGTPATDIADAPRASILDRIPVRFVVAALVIAGLIAIGLAMEAGKNQDRQNIYVLLSLPASILVQIFLNRRPIRALWVRDAPPFRLDTMGIALALLIAVAPVLTAIRDARHENWVFVAYDIVAIGGAFAAAYAIRAMTRETFRQLGLCLATAGVIGIGLNILHDIEIGIRDHYFQPLTRGDLDIGLAAFFLYLPALFVVEEVLFRGAIDSYVHRPGEGTGWLSALFVSMLWGWWHVPVFYPELPLWEAAIAVLPMQVLVGVPLSLWWRRSGNLAVSGVTHALNDSVRNALTGVP
ncbi:MAG: CPBP family intramembrane glutamic endopeptidase [Dehalococcoidia bacterium]